MCTEQSCSCGVANAKTHTRRRSACATSLAASQLPYRLQDCAHHVQSVKIWSTSLSYIKFELRDPKVNINFISPCQTVKLHLGVFVMPFHQSGTYYHQICGFQNLIKNIHVFVSLWTLDRLSSASDPPGVLALYKSYLLTYLLVVKLSWETTISNNKWESLAIHF